jgi:hypothetical protein
MKEPDNGIRRWSNLGAFPLKTLEDGLEGAVGIATLLARFFIILESFTQSLQTVIEYATEGLVNATSPRRIPP